MDFIQNEADSELASLSRKILTDQLTPDRLRAAEADGIDRRLWADLAAAGVLSAALPESLGGSGLGLLAHCAVLAELGREVAPVPYLPSIVLGAGGGGEPQGAPAPRGGGGRGKGEGEGGGGGGGGGRWLLSGVKTTVFAAP